MISSGLATRYARALFEASKEANTLDKVLEQLRAVAQAVESSADIQAALKSNILSGEEKKSALMAALKNLNLDEHFRNFLQLICDKKRLHLLTEIQGAFQTLIDQHNGVIRGTVDSVSSLNPEQRKSLEDRVSKATGRRVLLEYRENSSLIGGLVARVGSLTFDDSIETHLRKMKEELKRSTI